MILQICHCAYAFRKVDFKFNINFGETISLKYQLAFETFKYNYLDVILNFGIKNIDINKSGYAWCKQVICFFCIENILMCSNTFKSAPIKIMFMESIK